MAGLLLGWGCLLLILLLGGSQMGRSRRDYLKRLPPEYYRGQAYVHWSLAMQDRRTGWLDAKFHYKFRELLTHAAFRYGLCCPVFCEMPDHIHLLWMGISDRCDQRNAMKFFRGQLNQVLGTRNTTLQSQPYDHVLQDDERDQSAVEDVAEYIARNPEPKHLVADDHFADYPFTGCLVPGYPDLQFFDSKYWDLFWRLYSRLRHEGLTGSGEICEEGD